MKIRARAFGVKLLVKFSRKHATQSGISGENSGARIWRGVEISCENFL